MDSVLKHTRNAPLLVGLIGVIATFLATWLFVNVERSEAEMQFHQVATLCTESARSRVHSVLDLTYLLAAHMQSAPGGTRNLAAFTEFSRAGRKSRPYLQALSWAPRVKAEERAHFEQEARRDLPNYQFTEMEQVPAKVPPEGPTLIPRTPQTEYYPVIYLEPDRRDEPVLGFDLLSEPSLRAALERATASRNISVSGRIHLVYGKNDQYGVVLAAPVFLNSGEGDGKPIGFALAELRMNDLVGVLPADGNDPDHLVTLRIYDVSVPAKMQQLYPNPDSSPLPPYRAGELHKSYLLTVGDRTWEVVATPGPGYSGIAAWSSPLAVLLLGLVVTGVGTKYLSSAAEAQRKSAATAEELRHMNRALRARSRVNQTLTTAIDEQELLENTVNIIAQENGYPLVWIGKPEQDEARSITVLAKAGIDIAYLKQEEMTWADSLSGHGPSGTAIRERTTVLIVDLLTDPWFAPWAERAREHGLRSALSVPLIVAGDLVAVLTVYARDDGTYGDHAFRHEEVLLITELAKDLSFGIEDIRRRRQVEEEAKKRKQLEEQLQQSQRIEAVGRLAGGIAHDFNNLLMVIMAHTDLLMQNLPAPARERANNIMRSATRAAELTGQLLAFSRKQPVQPVLLTMNEVLDGMKDMMPAMLRADIDLHIERCRDPWTVKVDRNQFERVIMNLAVNARDAMPGGGRLTIHTGNRVIAEDEPRPWYMAAGSYATLSVSDTGTGMDEETQNHLFEPFFTTKEQGRGTGLGLSMVYGIVKKAEGYILVDSALGQGTTFTVYLPLCKHPGNIESELAVDAPVAPIKATVLLVEDDAKLRSVITDFLHFGGHVVLAASNTEEACRLGDKYGKQIMLVLSDVVLKGGNGPLVVKYLTELGLHFKTIYMSGYTGDAIEQHGVFNADQPFLQKPFSRNQLMTLIQEVLRAHD